MDTSINSRVYLNAHIVLSGALFTFKKTPDQQFFPAYKIPTRVSLIWYKMFLLWLLIKGILVLQGSTIPRNFPLVFSNCTISVFLEGQFSNSIEFSFQHLVLVHWKRFKTQPHNVINLRENTLRPYISQKYSEVCVLFFIAKIDSSKFTLLQDLNQAISGSSRKWPSYLPNYVVTLESGKYHKNGKHACRKPTIHKSETGGDINARFKLVIWNDCDNVVYIPCFRCLDSVGELISAVQFFINQSTTLGDLSKVWLKINSNFNFFIPNRSPRPCDRFHGPKKWKPNFRQSMFNIQSEDMCIIQLFLNIINCSVCTFDNNIAGILKRDWSTQAAADGKYILKTGSSSHGFKFKTIAHQSELRKKGNLAFLLKSFSLIEWITTAATAFSVVLLLCASGLTFDASISLTLASFLEQVNVPESKINKLNFNVIMAWIFTTMLIRNIFITKMFAALTADPTPTFQIPLSITEVLNIKDLPIIGDGGYLRAKAFSDFNNSLTTDSTNAFNILTERMYSFFYTGYGAQEIGLGKAEFVNLSFSKPIPLLKYNQTIFKAYFQTKSNNRVKKFSFPSRLKIFRKLTQLVMFYETFPSNTHLSVYFMLPLFDSASVLKIYENNHPEILTDFRLWFATEMNIVSILFENMIVKTSDTGLFLRITSYHHHALQKRVVKEYLSFLEWSKCEHVHMTTFKTTEETVATFDSLVAVFLLYFICLLLCCLTYGFELLFYFKISNIAVQNLIKKLNSEHNTVCVND